MHIRSWDFITTIQNFEFPSFLLLHLFWKKTTDTAVNHNSNIQFDNIPDHSSGLLTELEIQILNYYFSSFASLFNKDKFPLFKPASISPLTVLFQGEKKKLNLRFFTLMIQDFGIYCFAFLAYLLKELTETTMNQNNPPPKTKSHNRPLLFDFESQNLNLR